jgi:hypothetical protein
LSGILVTGFEPFGGAEAAGGGVGGPADPDGVVCFGPADIDATVVERFALNFDGSKSKDNDGVVSGVEIDPDGPAAYRSTLPVDAIVERLLRAHAASGAGAVRDEGRVRPVPGGHGRGGARPGRPDRPGGGRSLVGTIRIPSTRIGE